MFNPAVETPAVRCSRIGTYLPLKGCPIASLIASDVQQFACTRHISLAAAVRSVSYPFPLYFRHTRPPLPALPFKIQIP